MLPNITAQPEVVLIPDPLSMCKYLHKIRTMHSTNQLDLGSVLIVGKVRSKITSQPEVVPLINSLYDPLHCPYEFATDLILFLIY
jgi:hypothetical protein